MSSFDPLLSLSLVINQLYREDSDSLGDAITVVQDHAPMEFLLFLPIVATIFFNFVVSGLYVISIDREKLRQAGGLVELAYILGPSGIWDRWNIRKYVRDDRAELVENYARLARKFWGWCVIYVAVAVFVLLGLRHFGQI